MARPSKRTGLAVKKRTNRGSDCLSAYHLEASVAAQHGLLPLQQPLLLLPQLLALLLLLPLPQLPAQLPPQEAGKAQHEASTTEPKTFPFSQSMRGLAAWPTKWMAVRRSGCMSFSLRLGGL